MNLNRVPLLLHGSPTPASAAAPRPPPPWIADASLRRRPSPPSPGPSSCPPPHNMPKIPLHAVPPQSMFALVTPDLGRSAIQIGGLVSSRSESPPELLDDLCSQFVLNVLREYLETFKRILFHLEQAYWFGEYTSVEQNPSFKSLLFKEFTSLNIIVHRLLAATSEILKLPPVFKDKIQFASIADNLTYRHRNAQMAGRASVELHRLIYFKNRPVDTQARTVKIKSNGFIVFVPK